MITQIASTSRAMKVIVASFCACRARGNPQTRALPAGT